MSRPPQPHRKVSQAHWAAVLGILLAPAGLAQPKGAERLMHLQRPAPRAAEARPAPTQPSSIVPLQIQVGPYFGWDRCFTLSNGEVEVLIVPAIGRIQQFRFVGESGPFWEDPTLRGQEPDPAATEWMNFGGDKAWPAPQADWGKITSRSWPPPVAFDAMPVEMSVRRDTVVLTSPVDPHFGIRVERQIQLVPNAPVMVVRTVFEKIEGAPLTVGVWVVTQLEDPLAVFAPVPRDSRFPEGYNRQSGDDLPAQLTVDRRLLSLARDPKTSTKIGLDADRLLWVGENHMVLIESPRVAGATYPDQESSAEIYTNPDPKRYVELEMLGPLHRMGPGEQISQTNTYSLFRRRSNADPVLDARRLLQLP